MSEEKGKQQQITQEQVKEFAGKLQTFYDGLPADEKPVLEAVLKSAAGPETDVTGHSAQRGVTGYGDTSIEKAPALELFLPDGTLTFQMMGRPRDIALLAEGS